MYKNYCSSEILLDDGLIPDFDFEKRTHDCFVLEDLKDNSLLNPKTFWGFFD
jgi:hypothetical protein